MAAAPASAALDLTRLPAFQLVDVDYEAERARLLASLQARFAELGLPFDPTQETDPIVILAEEVAYNRILGLQAINDAGKRMTVAFGYGEALDHLAASYYADVGVQRLPTEPLDSAGDERFRRRIVLAASARSPGSLEGYEYWALTLGPHLLDARALNHASQLVAPGEVLLVLVGDPAAEGEAAEVAQVAAVNAGLLDRSRTLGTDTLIVRAAVRHEVALDAVLEVVPGPDAGVVVAEAQAAFAKYQAGRRKAGARAAVSAIHAALSVPGVERVRLNSPVADVVPGPDCVVEFTSVAIAAEPADG